MVEVVAVTENKRLLNSAIGKTKSDLFNYAQPSKTPDNNRFIAAAKEDRKIGLALANAKSNTPEYDNLYARRLELQAIKRINQPLETQESKDAKIVVFNKRSKELSSQSRPLFDSLKNPGLTEEEKAEIQKKIDVILDKMDANERSMAPMLTELD